MIQEDARRDFILMPVSQCEERTINRAQVVLGKILEAHYVSDTASRPVGNYQELISQVARLLVENAADVRPVVMLYEYFVRTGSERMEATLHDLGRHLMTKWGAPFDEVQDLLNSIVRRLAAIGRLRQMRGYR